MRPIEAPADSPEERALRGALTEAVDALPPLPDLVPAAVRVGRRRRARARAAKAGGAFGLVTAVALGLAVVNPWHGGREVNLPAVPVSPSVTGTGPGREPVHVEPRPGETFPHARLPEAARARLDVFQQRAAVVLDDLLPAAVGAIRPYDNDVRDYRGEGEPGGDARAGAPYTVRFSVRPSTGPAETCPALPKKGVTCRTERLADGTPAQVTRAPSNTRGAREVTLTYRHGRSDVQLSVTPDAGAAGSAPVSPADLVRLADDNRFRDLVREADARPILGRSSYAAD
ncbi:hypothetical protein [Streptomyces sp. NPDC058486]|uniref:hypothetical protein n=1 Tax=unclassified Streptomyces TaxID=2593676 RepID=UPI0036510F50